MHQLMHSGTRCLSRLTWAASVWFRDERHVFVFVNLDDFARACGTVNLISMCLLWNEYALI